MNVAEEPWLQLAATYHGQQASFSASPGPRSTSSAPCCTLTAEGQARARDGLTPRGLTGELSLADSAVHWAEHFNVAVPTGFGLDMRK